MNAGRIEKDDLRLGRGHHALDRRAGGLRLIRDNRDLLSHQRIQQRGFSGIRPANDRDESRLNFLFMSNRLRLADANLFDPEIVAGEHIDADAVALHGLARFGTRPSHSLTRPPTVVDFDIFFAVEGGQQVADAVEVEIAGDDEAALAVFDDVAIRLVLVADFADDDFCFIHLKLLDDNLFYFLIYYGSLFLLFTSAIKLRMLVRWSTPPCSRILSA